MKLDLQLTSEFETACDLLYWKPEEILQAFIEEVSLAKYYSKDKKEPDGFATSFVLRYVQLKGERLLPAKKIHEKYLYRLDTIRKKQQDKPYEERYMSLVQFFDEWRREVIQNLSEKDFVIDAKARKKQLGID